MWDLIHNRVQTQFRLECGINNVDFVDERRLVVAATDGTQNDAAVPFFCWERGERTCHFYLCCEQATCGSWTRKPRSC